MSGQEFCGIQLSESTYMEVSETGLCYLPCVTVDNTTDCPSQCAAKGGIWDSLASIEDPSSPYLCKSNISTTKCVADCESSVFFDPETGTDVTFYGSCEQYDMCVLDLNQTLCKARYLGTGGERSSEDGFPKWMSFNWSTMSLEEGGKNGACVLAYSNVLSFIQDVGGNQTYSSSESACVGFRAMLHNVSNAKNVSGEWRPARGLRPGFMDSNGTCKQICALQMWVRTNHKTYRTPSIFSLLNTAHADSLYCFPSQDPSADCSQEADLGYCSVPCSECRALMDGEPSTYGLDYLIPGGSTTSVCVDTSLSREECDMKDAWYFSPLSSICYMDPNSAQPCTEPYLSLDCNLFNEFPGGQDICPQVMLLDANNQTLLQCVLDTAAYCPDQASCVSTGSCDDSFLADPTWPSWMPTVSACVVPFTIGDDEGNPNVTQCESDGAFIQWDTGCIYWASTVNALMYESSDSMFGFRRHLNRLSARTVHAARDMEEAMGFVEQAMSDVENFCNVRGGYLATQATSEGACLDNSTRCIKDGWLYQDINKADCSSDSICSQDTYAWTAARQWSGGTWSSMDFVPTKWVHRAWSPINQYLPVFSYEKMTQLVIDAISRMIQDSFVSYVNCKTGIYSSAFMKLATAFENNPSQSMLNSLSQVELIPIAKQVFEVDLTTSDGRRASLSEDSLRAAAATTHKLLQTTTKEIRTTEPSGRNKTKSDVGLLLSNSVQNKSLINKTKVTVSTEQVVAVTSAPGDAVLSCTAGTVVVPQKSLMAAVTKGSDMDTITLTLSTTSSAQLSNPSLVPGLGQLGSTRRDNAERFGLRTLDATSTCTTSYAVVVNTQQVVVGQLIGSALSVTGEGLQGQSINLCFTADPTIVQCTTKFPVLDLALLSTGTSSASASTPLVVVQLLTVTQAGQQYCANSVPSPGPGQLYFPVRRSANVNPAAVVVLQFTFSSISDPSKFNPALQTILKSAIVAGLPASAGVTLSNIAITKICTADGTTCTPISRRRLLSGGVVATTAVTTSAAATVSSGSTSPSFAAGFLSSWNAASPIPLTAADLSVASLGIIQPLALPPGTTIPGSAGTGNGTSNSSKAKATNSTQHFSGGPSDRAAAQGSALGAILLSMALTVLTLGRG